MERVNPSSAGLIVLQRREKELERSLRYLLDAQSDALMAGISGDPGDDVMSNGSTTPTTHSPRSSTRSPVRPAARQRRPDLLSARRGIYKAVRELASIKTEEEALTKDELEQSEKVLEHLEAWGSKRVGLQHQIDTIQHQDIELKTRNLQAQASSLQDEIVQTEQKLARMRRQHQALLTEIAQVDNSVQSKLASYKSSLGLLEKEIQAFLADPPITEENKALSQSTLLSLPPARRTLEMAHGQWSEEFATLRKRSRNIKKERSALEQGAVVWKECVTEITDFERLLRQEMSTLKPSNSAGSISKLLSTMDAVISSVEEKARLANGKNWKLLIVCIGAELEAFKQGRTILENALEAAGGNIDEPKSDDVLRDRSPDLNLSRSVEYIGKQPARSSKVLSPKVRSPPVYDSDEGPDPELMVSKQDTDTE
jgi:hypothetical protein